MSEGKDNLSGGCAKPPRSRVESRERARFERSEVNFGTAGPGVGRIGDPVLGQVATGIVPIWRNQSPVTSDAKSDPPLRRGP